MILIVVQYHTQIVTGECGTITTESDDKNKTGNLEDKLKIKLLGLLEECVIRCANVSKNKHLHKELKLYNMCPTADIYCFVLAKSNQILYPELCKKYVAEIEVKNKPDIEKDKTKHAQTY